MNRNNDNVIEVPVQELPKSVEETSREDLFNLQDVAYMVMAGRTKDGETFFRTVGINDLIIIRGLIEYASDEIRYEFNKFFEKTKK